MNRRRFLRSAGGAALAGASCTRPPRQPNIVLIMADDLGYSDIGCFGSEIETPNLDRLATQGIRFTRFYNAARCCPTRASLMTGLYQHQAGVGHMWRRPKRPAPSYQGYLNDRCRTIAEVLREAGYRTFLSGKWHLAGSPDRPDYQASWPTGRGFDRFYGVLGGTSNYFRPRGLIDDGRRIKKVPEDYYLTDAITDRACRYIEEAGGEPYFLYAAYTAPHFPLHARPDDIEKYRERYRVGWDTIREGRYRRLLEMGLIDSRWPLSPLDSLAPRWDSLDNKEEWALRMAVFAAQVDCMDRGVGRILQTVQASGQEENTLVLFFSDNGGCQEFKSSGKPGAAIGSADSFETYRLPWANTSNTPFRLYKRWVHEGGISTPFLARWPGVIEAGGVSGEVGHVIDIMPTCMELSGARYPADAIPCEGLSLLPALKGGAWETSRRLFFEHEGNRAMIDGKWKLVSYVSQSPEDHWELYDLEADRTELHDRSADHPGIVAEMKGQYVAWAERCGVLSRERLEQLIERRYLAERLA